MNHHIRKSLAILAAAFCGSALAAVSAEEAKLLDGPTLTPWGAEQAGNKDGSIPAYTDERVKLPADYDPQEPRRLPDPWKDKPLYTITAQNMAQYADKMTEGQKMTFKKYPNFRMDVYQTHRLVHFPKWFTDFTKKNATSCKTQDNELAISGCWGGVPFPIPKTGTEVMWNHITGYQMQSWTLGDTAWIVDATGRKVLSGDIDASYEQTYFHDPSRTEAAKPDSLFYTLRWSYVGPTRKVGEQYLFMFYLNNVSRIYSYVPGQRRVKLAPDFNYDTPAPGNGGVVTIDEANIFYGAIDRFDFKLVGKQEKYIMFNNFKLYDYKTCPNEVQLATKNFMNPDCIRWELHRVWVVDAKLKPGFRHITPHRVMYFDEDTYRGGSSDDFDASGSLYKNGNAFVVQLYNSPNLPNNSECTNEMDFFTGMYSPVCIFGKKGHGPLEVPRKSLTFFSPEALAGEGVR